jgi:hypothetical protein
MPGKTSSVKRYCESIFGLTIEGLANGKPAKQKQTIARARTSLLSVHNIKQK